MKRLLRIGNVSLAAAIVLFAAFQCMRAQGPPPTPPRPPGAAPMTDPPKGALTLLKTYMTQGSPETYYDYEYDEALPIDGVTTFYCPWPGCTLEFEQNVNVYTYDYYTYDYGLYLGAEVDGTYYYSGELMGNYEEYTAVTFDWSVSLGPGKHTVQSVIYPYEEYLWLYYYHMNYRVYASGL